LPRYDDLVDGKEQKIDVSQCDVSMNGIELQDREFVAAIRASGRRAASVADVLPCYRWLDRMETAARGGRGIEEVEMTERRDYGIPGTPIFDGTMAATRAMRLNRMCYSFQFARQDRVELQARRSAPYCRKVRS